MKKLTKLLALALVVAMVLPMSALAAENRAEPKELWMQWINWDEENYQPDSEVHRNDPQITPYDMFHIAFYTSDDEGKKLTPVPADKLEASKGVTIEPLCPGVRGKESYAMLSVAEWDKEYTVSYKGYSLTVRSCLPDIGLYSAPEATIDNYMYKWGFSPVMDGRTAYVISTATDEANGRHVVEIAPSKGCRDNDSFKLEKVSDNVYKWTLTGGIDVQVLRPRLDITWQEGGNTYTDKDWQYDLWEEASVLIGNKPVPDHDHEKPELYNNVKGDFRNTLTLKAGESKTVYGAVTYFDEEHDAWIVRNLAWFDFAVSDSNLKLTNDSEDPVEVTVSCDVPGTYTMVVYNEDHPIIDALYHQNGKKFTEAEFKKFFDEEHFYIIIKGELMVILDEDTWEPVPFLEAFPEVKDVEFHHVQEDPWYPVTVTVEAAEKLPFTDVAENAWYAPAVRFVNSKKYMVGNSETTFDPQGKIRGSEFAQLLYNIAGKPAAADGASFQGVNSQWYAPAILWAAGEGIVTDTGDAAVIPEADLTRQQIALMFYNSLGKPEGSASLSAFADANQVSSWARAAMEWAVSAKVFQGSGGKLNPTGTATRAEVAQVLLNYFG